MAHVRQQIREAIAARLTGLTTTGANVFTSRVNPFLEEGAQLPGLAIFTGDEEIIEPDETTEIGTQHRMLETYVQGYAQALTADLEDTLDNIASEVEVAMFSDAFLGNLLIANELANTVIDIEPGATKPVGVVTLIFRMAYYTREGTPETAL